MRASDADREDSKRGTAPAGEAERAPTRPADRRRSRARRCFVAVRPRRNPGSGSGERRRARLGARPLDGRRRARRSESRLAQCGRGDRKVCAIRDRERFRSDAPRDLADVARFGRQRVGPSLGRPERDDPVCGKTHRGVGCMAVDRPDGRLRDEEHQQEEAQDPSSPVRTQPATPPRPENGESNRRSRRARRGPEDHGDLVGR